LAVRSEPRYEAILKGIEGEIRTRPEGARLSSFRALMGRFGASQATVAGVLRTLEKDGFIRRRRGSGIYVGPAAGVLQVTRVGTIQFLVPTVAVRAYALLVAGGEEAAREIGLRTQIFCYGERVPGSGLSVGPDVRGLVIVPRSIDVDTGAVRRCLARLPAGLRRVLVGTEALEIDCPSVGLDDFGAGVRVGEIFRKHRIRRLACVGTSGSHFDQRRLSGLEVGFRRPPETLLDFRSPQHFDRELLRQIVARGIDGLFIARPDIALQTLCNLQALGKRSPADIFVVTIAEQDDDFAYPFAVARVEKPTAELGREAVRALSVDQAAAKRLAYRVRET
jgi:DNA-binding LacI/PurR family transcriptional regulator